MPASRASSEQSNSMLYVLVVFIVLFLAAAVFAVVMFLKNADLVTAANNAESKLAKFGRESELRDVQPLVTGNKTVLSQLAADMRYLSAAIGGEEMANLSLAGAKATVEKKLKPLFEEKLPYALENKEAADPSLGLVAIVENLIAERDKWAERYMTADQEKANLQQLKEQSEKDLNAQIAELRTELDKATLAAKTTEETYQQRSADLTRRYQEQFDDINAEKTQLETDKTNLTKQVTDLQGEITKYDQKLKELETILLQVRPSPEMEMSALDPDGYVVSVNIRDKLAYINLAKDDHIYRGLTFTVYESYGDIPKDGKGKGSLEVIEIMDTISKCRIVDYDPTNPIMQKDIIANLIWDKNTKFKFCVAGDFDLNGDGKVDPEGVGKITSLIDSWGGEATSTLSVDTDFLVIGQEPVLPARPSESDMDRNTDEAIAYRAAIQREQAYKGIQKDGASLGVPTFNTNRFFRFIGYSPKVVD